MDAIICYVVSQCRMQTHWYMMVQRARQEERSNVCRDVLQSWSGSCTLPSRELRSSRPRQPRPGSGQPKRRRSHRQMHRSTSGGWPSSRYVSSERGVLWSDAIETFTGDPRGTWDSCSMHRLPNCSGTTCRSTHSCSMTMRPAHLAIDLLSRLCLCVLVVTAWSPACAGRSAAG